jgi:hypothetical protein
MALRWRWRKTTEPKSDQGVLFGCYLENAPRYYDVEGSAVPEYSPLHYIDMEVRDQSGKGFTATRGLLDSGSQGSCVNQKFSQDVLTDHKLKATPTTLIMADGNNSPAGPITHYDHVTARIAGHEEQLALDTASLSHPIILGMPWHKKHNPCIDYPKNTLTFDSETCRENCDHYGKTIALHSSDQVSLDTVPNDPAASETHGEMLEQIPEPTMPAERISDGPKLVPDPIPDGRPQVALIGAAASHTCATSQARNCSSCHLKRLRMARLN